ncbi:hypothetical protein KNE206_57240 [Kitasatospora sp. NE20-6]
MQGKGRKADLRPMLAALVLAVTSACHPVGPPRPPSSTPAAESTLCTTEACTVRPATVEPTTAEQRRILHRLCEPPTIARIGTRVDLSSTERQPTASGCAPSTTSEGMKAR